MKKSLLLAAAFVFAMGAALAHGPPSAINSRSVVAQQVSLSVPVGGGLTSADNGGGAGCITSHGGGSGWITSAAGTSKMVPFFGKGVPPNERMLN